MRSRARNAYRTSTPIEDRVGPSGTDLQQVRVTDYAATERVVGAGLSVRRVTHNVRDDVSRLVEWDRPASPEDKARAEQLLSGYSVQHA